ncbi:hypothetical protein Zmor_015291 [Zophobas morio]|uniref:Reverse transcriptase domain-containing protein n=1 Tax=Zophobas morio TaxID=2755281 RepID=A0AA38MGF8_9CUCU|nr:hypothetical protein Zmor_015291 [Zophobas morio]
MSSGFWQIKLDKENSALYYFNTPYGRYKFLRLPFGIKSAPEVFQKKVEQIFGDIEGVNIIFDDLITAASTEEEHDRILGKVMKRAEKNKVKFNKNKLQFKVKAVKFLGNIVSEKGLVADPEKVKTIAAVETPQSKEELKRFLGMK